MIAREFFPRVLKAVPVKLVVGCNVAVWAAASYCALVARNADLVAVPKPKFPRRVTGFDTAVGGGRNDRGALPLIYPRSAHECWAHRHQLEAVGPAAEL